MSSDLVDPYSVKPRPSTTAVIEADPWNPWRTLVEKYPHVQLILDRELPGNTWGLAKGNQIWICKRLSELKRTCTLAHEITHFELNSSKLSASSKRSAREGLSPFDPWLR
jgi:hypothetical protein